MDNVLPHLTSAQLVQPPSFYGSESERRIVHQIWDWVSEERYAMHLYITTRAGGRWECRHFAAEYRALRHAELDTVLENAGFRRIEWMIPEESRFHQPIVIAG